MAEAARRTRVDYASALDLIRATHDEWRPRALAASALHSEGVEAVWETIVAHHDLMREAGHFEARRRDQARAWMWKLIEEGIARAFRDQPGMSEAISAQETAVAAQKATPAGAARSLLARFRAAGDGEDS